MNENKKLLDNDYWEFARVDEDRELGTAIVIDGSRFKYSLSCMAEEDCKIINDAFRRAVKEIEVRAYERAAIVSCRLCREESLPNKKFFHGKWRCHAAEIRKLAEEAGK